MKKLSILLALVMTSVLVQSCSNLHASKRVKKVLVVSTTTGFRHSSIPTSEKVLAQLAKDSGAFTLDFVQQPPGHAAVGFPVKLKPEATAEEKQAFAEAEAKWTETLKAELQKLSPASLKNYDAVLFLSTTGDLPIPDQDGFLAWIKEGGAFIGIHAASDTYHGWPAFIDMIGGEFRTHGAQVSVDCLNEDPTHPATAHLGRSWHISQEEIYLFKKYDASKVSELLVLDKHPNDKTAGRFGVSWTKPYGKGRVFYTSLGHREDIWDADLSIRDRKNAAAISQDYQAHVLGGIKWALGLDAGRQPAKLD